MKTLTTLILITLIFLSASVQARPSAGIDSRQTLGGPGPHWQTISFSFGGWLRLARCQLFGRFCQLD